MVTKMAQNRCEEKVAVRRQVQAHEGPRRRAIHYREGMAQPARDDVESTDLHLFDPPCGPVAGIVDGAVVRSSAIPYARADRFAAPEPCAVWTVAHHCEQPAPACPQLPSPLVTAMFGGPPTALVADEDCQRLTITRPAGEIDTPLPVMVWVHGGSYVLGAGDEAHHDPTTLVVEQNVIVVAVTYRLGVLGFLGDGSLERPANLGLLDLIAALDWVHDNIAAFGGDPDQITCVGQSAGADAVAHLMTVPRATRRFRRAILQSAPFGIRWNRSDMARDLFSRTMEFDDSTGLDEILSVQQKLIVDGPRYGLTGAMPFGVQYGLEPLPAESDVEEAWAESASDIDLLVGCNRDEIEFFVPGVPIAETASHVPILGRPIRRVVTSLITRRVYSAPTADFARKHAAAGGRVVDYRVHWHAPGNNLGAAHCIELPLLFGVEEQWEGAQLLEGATWEQVEEAGRVLRAIWGRFLRGEDLGECEPLEARSVLRYRQVSA